jgi:hypothetical protein
MTPFFYRLINLGGCNGLPGTVISAGMLENPPLTAGWDCDTGMTDCTYASGTIIWGAPSDSGGCPIIGYKVGRYDYSLITPENADPSYDHGDQARYTYGDLNSAPDNFTLNGSGGTAFCPAADATDGSNIGPDTYSITFSGLTCGTYWNYAVAAVNTYGTGPWRTISVNGNTGGFGGPIDPISITTSGNYVDLTYDTNECSENCSTIISIVAISGYLFNAGTSPTTTELINQTETPVATTSSLTRGALQFLNPIDPGVSGLYEAYVVETYLVQVGSGNDICRNVIPDCGKIYWYLEG